MLPFPGRKSNNLRIYMTRRYRWKWSKPMLLNGRGRIILHCYARKVECDVRWSGQGRSWFSDSKQTFQPAESQNQGPFHIVYSEIAATLSDTKASQSLFLFVERFLQFIRASLKPVQQKRFNFQSELDGNNARIEGKENFCWMWYVLMSTVHILGIHFVHSRSFSFMFSAHLAYSVRKLEHERGSFLFMWQNWFKFGIVPKKCGLIFLFI